MRQKHCAIRPHAPAGLGFGLGFRQGQLLLQDCLNVTPDGEFGPETEKALMRYQEEQDLRVCGADTLGRFGRRL